MARGWADWAFCAGFTGITFSRTASLAWLSVSPTIIQPSSNVAFTASNTGPMGIITCLLSRYGV